MGAACGQAGTNDGDLRQARVEELVSSARVEAQGGGDGMMGAACGQAGTTTEDLVAARVEAARAEVMVAGWAPRVDKLARTTEDLEAARVEELVSPSG